MLKIGNVTLPSDIILGPMAGVTDLPFRRICREFGCMVTTSEMISSKAMHFNDKKTLILLEKHDSEDPFIVQIFGSDPDIMGECAKRVESMGIATVIDINMGCPAPKIVNNGDGCALMKNETLASKIISSVVNAVDLPVTVKFRSGWDENNINASSFAKMAEESGASAITVHGRTREAFYSGKADWDIVKKIKDNSKIPVIVSGDIFSKESISYAKKYIGCDGFMVARGSLGNPFIFSDKVYSQNEILDTAIRHLLYIVEYKGEYVGVKEARKHMCWYIKGMYGAAQTKVAVNSSETTEQMISAINSLRN